MNVSSYAIKQSKKNEMEFSPMTQSERIDSLSRAGWRPYRTFPRWRVFARKTQEKHLQFNPQGLEFITVFKNGRTASGFINAYPNRSQNGM